MNSANPDSPLPRSALRAFEAAQRPDAPIRLGVLTNLRSGQGRGIGYRGRVATHAVVRRELNGRGVAVHTEHPHEVEARLAGLLFDDGVNVLAFNGGDGTLHHAVNSLWRLLDRIERGLGRQVSPPAIVLLRGGTMNMAARALGHPGEPTAVVRDFLSATRFGTLGDVHTRQVPLLSVADGGHQHAPHLGLIFGTELVRNALWMYAQFGEGYRGLARLVTHASLGVAFDTALWREYGHLLDAPRTAISIDGVMYPRYAAAVASTIDLTLMRGLVHTIHVSDGTPGFSAKLLLETHKARLVSLIPRLMRSKPHPRVLERESVQRLEVRGPFTLDGELFDPTGDQGSTNSPNAAPRVAVTLSPRPLSTVPRGFPRRRLRVR